MMRRIVALTAALALSLALAACQSKGDDGSSGGAGGSSGGSRGGATGGTGGVSAPAAAKGECTIGPHTIANVKGTIVGTLNWECTGSVSMNLNVRLIYVDNNTGDEAKTHPDEGGSIYIDNVLYTSPQTVRAPCHTGLWKMKVVGQIEGLDSPPIVVNTSDKTNPPFNTPHWQTPTAIEC